MNIIHTERGFAVAGFVDRYGKSCSIQKSSLATEDCIWLGIDDPDPKIMASQAREYGLSPGDGTGFVPYPVPAAVHLTTRMHLTQEMAAALIPLLQRFVETGELDA